MSDIQGRAIRYLLQAGNNPTEWLAQQNAVVEKMVSDYPDDQLFTLQYIVLKQRLMLNVVHNNDPQKIVDLRRGGRKESQELPVPTQEQLQDNLDKLALRAEGPLLRMADLEKINKRIIRFFLQYQNPDDWKEKASDIFQQLRTDYIFPSSLHRDTATAPLLKNMVSSKLDALIDLYDSNPEDIADMRLALASDQKGDPYEAL